jgi:hypothetical protein
MSTCAPPQGAPPRGDSTRSLPQWGSPAATRALSAGLAFLRLVERTRRATFGGMRNDRLIERATTISAHIQRHRGPVANVGSIHTFQINRVSVSKTGSARLFAGDMMSRRNALLAGIGLAGIAA